MPHAEDPTVNGLAGEMMLYHARRVEALETLQQPRRRVAHDDERPAAENRGLMGRMRRPKIILTGPIPCE